VYASRPFGLYTSLIFSSYSSYRLNSSSNLTPLTKPFWAQKAFGGVREMRLRAVPRYVILHRIRVEDVHRSLHRHLHHPWESAHNLGDLKLGEEYEQWKDHIKTTEERRCLVITHLITHQLLQRLAQNPNTTKLNEKLKNTQKQRHAQRTAAPGLLTRRSWVRGESRPTNPTGPASLVFSYLDRVSV
jgi:hypothetical protein